MFNGLGSILSSVSILIPQTSFKTKLGVAIIRQALDNYVIQMGFKREVVG